jgi:hypothetical protein
MQAEPFGSQARCQGTHGLDQTEIVLLAALLAMERTGTE